MAKGVTPSAMRTPSAMWDTGSEPALQTKGERGMRIWWEDGVFWLGDLAVLPAFRNRRLGDLVLRLLLFKAQQHFAREVRLRCPPEVVGFFDRLGLRPADVAPSDKLIELWIPGEKIDLDSCKSCRKEGCPNRVP